MMRRPAARSALPVSVMSTTASAMSGTLASVAPYDREISASIPWAAKARRVSSGYSELMRSLPGWAASSAKLVTGEEPASSPSETTSLPRSSMQSRPVIPRSKSPSAM